MQGVAREPGFADALAVFRRVLVPVDFSMVAQRGVHVALELGRRFEGRVCLFNLTKADDNDQFLAGLGSPTGAHDLVERGRGALRRFVENIAPGYSDAVEYDVRVDDDYVHRIREKTAEWDASLLIVSHETHPALWRTHTERLMKSLTIPVLVLQSPPDPKT